MPSRAASTWATAADGGTRSVTTRQRDLIVVTRSSADGAHSSQTVRGAGSSIALSSALAACSVHRSASSNSTTLPAAARSARPPRAAPAPGSASRRRTAPRGGRAAGRRGCPRAPGGRTAHSPQPPDGHSSAAANARAATDRPDPGGPVNSQACVIAPGRRALAQLARRPPPARRAQRQHRSCPDRSSKTARHGVLGTPGSDLVRDGGEGPGVRLGDVAAPGRAGSPRIRSWICG